MTAIEKKIESLRAELHRHNHLYYIEARPEISDREFDKKMQELIDLEKAHPELLTPDSPSQRVGGEPISELKSVKHAVPMMSIDNTYTEEEVRSFDERMKKALGEQPAYVLEPKIDGTSISLRYEKGKLVLAATRGRGNLGDDVTENAKKIRTIPLVLNESKKHPIPDVVEVRGEIYMDNEDFQKVNAELEKAGEEPYANPRNLTAGTLRRLDPRIVAKRRLRFLAHGLGEVKPEVPTETYFEWIKCLKEWGLPLPTSVTRVENVDEALKAIHAFEKTRPTLPYMTDGIVMKVDDFKQRDELGFTSKSPRWVIAFKYETEQQPTVLNDVRWQVGKGGNLTPVGDLEPVFIGGVTVTHATLHNIDQIRRLDMHIGDTVIVERAGEVIPYVAQVDKTKRPKGAKPVTEPKKCPVCDTPVAREALAEASIHYRCINTACDEFFERKKVKREKGITNCPACEKKVEILDAGIDIFCPNKLCPAQVKERIRWFCARSQMDIEGLGDKLVNQLVDSGKVKGFADLYRLKKEDLLDLERMGDKSAQSAIDEIQKSKQQPLDRVLAGLGIPHIGTGGSRRLAEAFGSLDAIEKASQEQIAAVNDVGDVTAQSVFDFFHTPETYKQIQDLQSVGVDPKQEVVSAKSKEGLAFSGKSIVVTGTLKNLSRQEIEDLILKLGGKASGSVSKKTSFLVAGEEAGSKLDKAKSLGVEVITEEEFLKRAGK